MSGLLAWAQDTFYVRTLKARRLAREHAGLVSQVGAHSSRVLLTVR